MAVTKTSYCCQNCGAQHSKWLGQCSSCKEWNTLIEEVIKKSSKVNLGLSTNQLKSKAKLVNDIDFENDPRLLIDDKEDILSISIFLDHCLCSNGKWL